MSVDYYSCKYCGDTFCDCGDYVQCDCGEHWCSDECAEEDGFKRESCKSGYDTEDNQCEIECWRCKDKLESNCNYCREENFEDNELLRYVLDKHLNMSRQELIDDYKLYKGGL